MHLIKMVYYYFLSDMIFSFNILCGNSFIKIIRFGFAHFDLEILFSYRNFYES